MYTAKPLEQRFLSRVRKPEGEGCWEWTAYKDKDGYGRISFNFHPKRAHRASYEIYCGEIPEGLSVLHRCDNPGCVNPDHLFLGNTDDNMADKVAKKRQASGASHARPNAKLVDAEVIAIRAAKGFRQWELAAIYGVGQDEISRIRTGKRWAHI
jgi:hypothetical protein